MPNIRVNKGASIYHNGRLYTEGERLPDNLPPGVVEGHLKSKYAVDADARQEEVPADQIPGRDQVQALLGTHDGTQEVRTDTGVPVVVNSQDGSGAAATTYVAPSGTGTGNAGASIVEENTATASPVAANGDQPAPGNVIEQQQTPWNVDPATLEGKNLDELNVMVLEKDDSMEPFEDEAEAKAQLSKDFKPNKKKA